MKWINVTKISLMDDLITEMLINNNKKTFDSNAFIAAFERFLKINLVPLDEECFICLFCDKILKEVNILDLFNEYFAKMSEKYGKNIYDSYDKEIYKKYLRWIVKAYDELFGSYLDCFYLNNYCKDEKFRLCCILVCDKEELDKVVESRIEKLQVDNVEGLFTFSNWLYGRRIYHGEIFYSVLEQPIHYTNLAEIGKMYFEKLEGYEKRNYEKEWYEYLIKNRKVMFDSYYYSPKTCRHISLNYLSVYDIKTRYIHD